MRLGPSNTRKSRSQRGYVDFEWRLSIFIKCFNNIISNCNQNKKDACSWPIQTSVTKGGIEVHCCDPSLLKYIWQASLAFCSQMKLSPFSERWQLLKSAVPRPLAGKNKGLSSSDSSEEDNPPQLTVYNLSKNELYDVVIPRLDMLPRTVTIQNISLFEHTSNHTFAVKIESSTLEALNKLFTSLTKDCIVSPKVQITHSSFDSFANTYTQIKSPYAMRANLVNIETRSIADALASDILQLQHYLIEDTTVIQHDYNDQFLVHITFSSTYSKNSFIHDWIRGKIALRRKYHYSVYTHSNNYNKEIFFQHHI